MKVLIISLDSSILNERSGSRGRMKEYAELVDELHVFCFGKKAAFSGGNLFLYGFNSSFFGWLQAFFFGRKLVKEKKINVVSAQDPFEVGLLGFLISKFSQFHSPDRGTVRRVGFNVQLHGDFYGNPYWRQERILNRLRWHLGLFVLRRANSIRVVSDRIKLTLNSLFLIPDSKIIKVPIWTDTEYYKNSQPSFSLETKYPQFNFIILTVANLLPVKNLDFLIRAMKKLHEILPNAGLIIVGDGPLRKKLESRIKNQESKDYVVLAGKQQDLISYYKGADCFVLVSKYEGWGRAVIEAAASGLPVVMTNVGLAGEVIRNNESGIVLEGFSEHDLARAISQIYFNENLRKKLIAGAADALKELPPKQEIVDYIKKSWEMTI